MPRGLEQEASGAPRLRCSLDDQARQGVLRLQADPLDEEHGRQQLPDVLPVANTRKRLLPSRVAHVEAHAVSTAKTAAVCNR